VVLASSCLVLLVLFLESSFLLLVVLVCIVGFGLRVFVAFGLVVFWYSFSGFGMLVFVVVLVSGFHGVFVVFLGLFGFGIKFPVFPWFDWLPELHVEVSQDSSCLLAGVVLKSSFWAFLVSVSLCSGFVVFFVESVAFLGVCLVLFRLFFAVDVKRVVALFSVLHLSAVVHFVFHEFVYSFCLLCLVQWLHVVVASSLFFVLGLLVDVFGLRVFSGFFGFFGFSFLSSFCVFVFMVSLELPVVFGFFVDIVVVVLLVSWSLL
jgi:NADH:ubiquinone oxidoreductase subunit 4 (subunit M)